MLRCVLYISTARAGITRDEVDDIVATSKRRNAAEAITGVLLFNGANFMQLIEGPVEPLGGLMRRLYADQRHHGLIKLVDRAIEARACGDWALQPIAIGLPQAERRAAVAGLLPDDMDGDLRMMIVNFAQLN
jgi:hypothetical protein